MKSSMLRRGSSLLSSLLKPKESLLPDDTDTPEPASASPAPPERSSGSLLDAIDRIAATPLPSAPTSPAQKNELALQSFNEDLLRLVNLTQSTLTRAMRPQLGGRADSSLGPLQKGVEIAESIEQRGRGILLETSLTAEQRPRVFCATQNAQDQSVALRTTRYVWQICTILTTIPGGNGTFARVKRLVALLTELNGKVAAVLETGQGNEKAAAAEVAAQYRALLQEQREVVTVLRHDISASPLARRLGGAAVTSLVIAGESMTRVAARLAYPEAAMPKAVGPQRPDVNDGILRPLPLR